MNRVQPIRLALGALSLGAILALAACGTPTKTLPAATATAPGSAPGPAYGKTTPGEFVWSPRMGSAESKLSSSLRGSGVQVAKTSDERLWLTLPGDQAFEPNRSALKPEARQALDRIVMAVRDNPKAEFRIVGHTDANGSAAANNALSLDRAAATRDWLVARGLSPIRMAVAGRGARDPVGSNADEAGRASNRRVEILVGERK
ncbi:MAG: hypothetical protein RLZZ618_546 [Pseudomonadota bacterium]|jgi:outer membrane protein OmpA-like peptidoglycan-associated protein